MRTHPRATAVLSAAVLAAGLGAVAAAGPSTAAGRSAPHGKVVAGPHGVELRVDGQRTFVTRRRSSAGHSVGRFVAFQLTGPGTPVKVWARDGTVRRLATPRGVELRSLVGAGRVDGRPVALVAETRNASDPQRSSDALVAVDLVDGDRTRYARQGGAFESGYTQAHVLPGGDVVALRFDAIAWALHRLRPGGRTPVWRTTVAYDRAVSLAAVGRRLTVVESTYRGDGWVYQLERFRPGNGERASVRRFRSPDTHEAASCTDWFAPRTLSCTSEHQSLAVRALGARTGETRAVHHAGFGAVAVAAGSR